MTENLTISQKKMKTVPIMTISVSDYEEILYYCSEFYFGFQYDSRRIPKQKFPRARGFSDNIFYPCNSFIGDNTRAF